MSSLPFNPTDLNLTRDRLENLGRRKFRSLAILMAFIPGMGADLTLNLGMGLGPMRHPPRRPFLSVETDITSPSTWIGGWASLDSSTGGTFFGFGPSLRYPREGRWMFVATSGPGWYANHGVIDLGNPLEFRSSASFYHVSENGYRLGLSVSHYSNGGISPHNPGAETFRLLIGIPIKRRATAAPSFANPS